MDDGKKKQKSKLHKLYNRFVSKGIMGKVLCRHSGRDTLHGYWRQPETGNLPENYLNVDSERSEFLVNLVKKYYNNDARILELGCNAGRNLSYLFQAGFKQLEAVEINSEAIDLMKSSYPEMAESIKISNSSIEEFIKAVEDGRYDLVFSMAVLEHIHKDSEWIFSEMARITKVGLITIEDEKYISERHFPRNYKKIFEGFQLKQVEAILPTGLNQNFRARVFQKIDI